MTDTPPDAAVRIVTRAIESCPWDYPDVDVNRAVVTVLARAGWLHDPAEVAALRAALSKIQAEVDHADQQGYWSMDVGPVRAALDATPKDDRMTNAPAPDAAQEEHWQLRGDFPGPDVVRYVGPDPAPAAERLHDPAEIERVVTPEMQEPLAAALEEAAVRVRQSIPDRVEIDVEDDIDWIWVGPTERIPGMRSPLRRRFDIQW